MEESNWVQKSNKWLDDLSKGRCHELEVITMKNLQVLQSEKGFVRCNFTVSPHITDLDGNWHVGAMAVAIDNVGAAAIFSFAGHIKASLDFSISYYSSAKIGEEVEIMAKVVGDKGRISSVVIEVRRKDNGDLIALGKQWMASHNNIKINSKI